MERIIGKVFEGETRSEIDMGKFASVLGYSEAMEYLLI